MNPKKLFILTASDLLPEGIESLRGFLSPLVLHAAFAEEGALSVAEKIWEGRNGPPLFMKCRRRPALDSQDYGSFLDEVLGQV